MTDVEWGRNGKTGTLFALDSIAVVPEGEVGGDVRVNHLHFKTLCTPGNGLPDSAAADDAKRLARHLGAPTKFIGLQLFLPDRTNVSHSIIRLAVANNNVQVRSALASVTTSGVLTT